MGTDPLFMKIGPEYYFYHNDHIGTPQKMTSVSRAVVWSAKYDSFGKATVDPESSIVNPLRMAGQYNDAETGLHYNYHRYYDPRTGRYLTPDPIGLAGGINLFAYTANDPVNFFDPLGLTKEQILQAYNWIKTHHSEITEGVDPTFYDVDLPWDGGISLPFDIILIDTKDLETMEWIVNMTAHELLHAQPGYMPHNEIYQKAEEVRKDYMDWLEEQNACD